MRSALESARFGVEFGRLDATAVRPGALADAVAAADAEGLQVLSARVDSTELKLLTTLEDLGFRLMDTLVYYGRDPSKSVSGIKTSGLEPPMDLTGADAETCAAIARRAFHDYVGHYHTDPRLAAEAADEAYADWISRLLLTPAAGQICVGSAKQGRLVGFLVGQRRDPGTSEIVLNAVSPQEQRGGRYTALLLHYLHRVGRRGDREVVISTQLQNTAVQSVWARTGFTLFRSYHTLHRWAADG
ncbi:MAG: GNAT family N-acetyltransferase [Sphingomonas sp.]